MKYNDINKYCLQTDAQIPTKSYRNKRKIKRNGIKRPLNISIQLRSTKTTSDILSRNDSERIQLINNDRKTGTKSSHMFQHLISDPVHELDNPLKGLLRFLSHTSQVLLKAFQNFGLVLLFLLKIFLVYFKLTTCLYRIFGSLHLKFISLNKSSLHVRYWAVRSDGEPYCFTFSCKESTCSTFFHNSTSLCSTLKYSH